MPSDMAVDAPRAAAASEHRRQATHQEASRPHGLRAQETARGAADAPRRRDPRLDFFRGAGMFIILIAHVPWNGWAQWIPARFGFSDATEIFVFCSGMASAIAFGRVFDREGFAIGTARIAYRVWQIYWAHMCLMFLLITILVGIDAVLGGDAYVRGLNLQYMFSDPKTALVGLFTLTYVPNYFDILPMYLVMLAMVPGVVALGRIDGKVALAASVVLWGVASARVLDLPAEPWSDRTWYFNPFAWQLIFFLGFAFGRGWLKGPVPTRTTITIAAAIAIASIPFAWHRGFFYLPVLETINQSLFLLIDKSHLGILRVVHFLALAHLAVAAAGEGGRRLGGWFSEAMQLVGRQSLAVFLTGIILAQLMGMTLDLIGRTLLTYAIVNLAGFAVLYGAARVSEFYRAPPWKAAKAHGHRHAGHHARSHGGDGAGEEAVATREPA